MQGKYSRALFSIVLGLFALISVYPLIWLVLNSFKDTADIVTGDAFALPRYLKWENYHYAIVERGIMRYFANSMINTILTIVLVVTLASMLAYACTRMIWKGGGKTLSVITLGILFPSQIVVAQIFVLIRTLQLSNTRWSLILTVGAFNLAFATLIAAGFLRTIPNEVEEAAVVDGAGIWSIFFRIMLPILRPAVATVAINVFLSSWNEFLYALILIRDEGLKTLPISLTMFDSLRYGKDYGALFATMVITSIIPIVMYIAFSSQVENALTAGAILK